MRLLYDLKKIRKNLAIMMTVVIFIGAGLFILQQYNESAPQGVLTSTSQRPARIYSSDRYIEPAATDESGRYSGYISKCSGKHTRVVNNAEPDHLRIVSCFSISIAITCIAAYYAVTQARQSYLNIIHLIQRKDGKK